MKLSGVRYLTRQGFDNVWKNRMMAFASFCVLLVSLLLVGLSILFYININSIIGGIENKNEVIVFLDENITPAQTMETEVLLKQIDNIDEVRFYSKDDAFEDSYGDEKNYNSCRICDHYSACYSIYGYYFKYNQSKRICEKK